MATEKARQVSTICFDALGTLLDPAHSFAHLESAFPSRGTEIGNLWRSKQIDYSRLRSMSGKYADFDQITSDALVATFAHLAIPIKESDIDAAMDAYQNCAMFPDAAKLLESLHQPWAVVTNGNRKWIGPMLTGAGVEVSDSHLFTSDQVRTFKINAPLYQLGWEWAQGASRSAISKEDVLFVSANQWDAIGATWFGFTACWVNRIGQSPEQLGVRPKFEIRSLDELVAMDIVST
jgi:2-haloacid dehalogenase